MTAGYLTDSQRGLLPIPMRLRYRFWLDFNLHLATRSPTYRRWFQTIETRNQYILDLPANCAVTDSGEEPV